MPSQSITLDGIVLDVVFDNDVIIEGFAQTLDLEEVCLNSSPCKNILTWLSDETKTRIEEKVKQG